MKFPPCLELLNKSNCNWHGSVKMRLCLLCLNKPIVYTPISTPDRSFPSSQASLLFSSLHLTIPQSNSPPEPPPTYLPHPKPMPPRPLPFWERPYNPIRAPLPLPLRHGRPRTQPHNPHGTQILLNLSLRQSRPLPHQRWPLTIITQSTPRVLRLFPPGPHRRQVLDLEVRFRVTGPDQTPSNALRVFRMAVDFVPQRFEPVDDDVWPAP